MIVKNTIAGFLIAQSPFATVLTYLPVLANCTNQGVFNGCKFIIVDVCVTFLESVACSICWLKCRGVYSRIHHFDELVI